MRENLKHCKYTVFHPVIGFEEVKWNGKGSYLLSFAALFLFFLINVFSAQLTGFSFNGNNPDKISLFSIFAVSVGGVLLWFIANWAVSSLMDGEGKTGQIWVVTCYSLIPYIVFTALFILASNFASLEMATFLYLLQAVGIAWTCLMMFFGLYQIHQLDFKGTVVNVLLTIFGIAVMLFLMVMIYSLFQQIYSFLYTLFSEIMFRM
ncbi:MAG TPA: YIP1 family protein [Firmicutes bacterium]|nr:YIP1 family protein [Bacillota bacterium]